MSGNGGCGGVGIGSGCGGGGQTILDCIMHKLPSIRKNYRVTLIVPDNGIPFIEYHQTNASKKPKKSIPFVDLLFADKKHDTNDEKFAFSIYTTDKTITFLAQDETSMNEWLLKIAECHSNLYPEFKRYDAVFEATLLDSGLAKTLNIRGPYRVALCKESVDLIPLQSAPHLNSNKQQQQQHQQQTTTTAITNTTTSPTTTATITTTTTHHHFQNHHLLHSLHSHHHHSDPTTRLPAPTHYLHSSSSATPTSLVNSLNTTSTPTATTIIPHSVTNRLTRTPHLIRNHLRFHRRHPQISSRTIELVLKSIRRYGHTDCNFFIEPGRQSQIGQGDLWMNLGKKSIAKQLHELLRATMQLSPTTEDPYKPRSRSGSSSENAHHRPQQARASLICLASSDSSSTATATSTTSATSNLTNHIISINNNNNSNRNNNNNNNNNNFNLDEDNGYLPMA